MTPPRHRSPFMLCLMGLLTALLIVSKEAMSFLPNIEPVTFLLIVYTRTWERKVWPIVGAFVLVEGILYGFGQWWFSYLYIWGIWTLFVQWQRRRGSRWFWAAAAGAYGLLFGPLCALVPLVLYGPASAIAYWIAGIPFDLLHGVGNYALTAALFPALSSLLQRSYHRTQKGK